MLVNAHDAKNLPGRKTDVSDAAWLAQLAAHGLLRASFVPPEPIRELRDLTRTRTAITRARTREAQRLEKVLEDAGIKLSVVATDITGVSGRAILAAMVAGQRDAAALADLSVRQLRVKIPALTQALTGRFTEHHAFMVDLHCKLIDQHTTAIDTLTRRIEEAMVPFRATRELICSIPGIGIPTADVIIAETGAEHERLSPPQASWRCGLGCVPDTTSPPAGRSRARPAPGTGGSRAPSARPPCRSPDTAARSCTSSTNGWSGAAATPRPLSRSNTPYSRSCGAC